MKKVFISIITYNGNKITEDCLHSIEKSELRAVDLHVVVIDNASKEPFPVEHKHYKKFQIHVLRNEFNTGFSGGHNRGLRYALEHGAEYIIVLNNDTKIDEFLIERLVQVAEEREVGIVVPKIYFVKGSEYHKDRYSASELGKVFWYAGGMIDWDNVIGKNKGVDEVDKGQYDEITTTEVATGCCMLIKRTVLEKIGFFDEKYFLYYEDTDISLRAKLAGFSIAFNPFAIVWHRNAASSGGSGSHLQDYFISRNRLLFGYKYAPLRAKIALFRESMKLLFKGRNWQKRGIFDYYLGIFGKGSYTEIH